MAAQVSSAHRVAVLRQQYQLIATQLDVMCDQYDMWKIRHERATRNGQKVFQYPLYLRLITLDGCIQMAQVRIQAIAEHLVIEMSMTGDLDNLEELGIQLMD